MRTTVRIRTRDRWLALLAIVGFLVICVAASAGRAQHGRPAPTVLQSASAKPKTFQADPSDALEAPPPARHFRFQLPLHWLAKLSIIAAALGLVALIWLIVGVVPRLSYRRRRPSRAPPEDEAVPELAEYPSEELNRTFATALTAVAIGDANRAIVACWIRLEQIAEDCGYVRLPSETSTELVTKWLGATSLPTGPLGELAQLYREARYSGHAMSAAATDRARTALTQLRAAFVPAQPTGRADG